MAQQLKTAGVSHEIASDDLEALPQLTDQQNKFVELLLGGATASDAYRGAYNTSNMKPNTIWSSASILKSDPKVSAWVDAAKMAAVKHAKCTYEGHLTELERLKTIAVRSGNIGAAVQAEQLRGKASGFYVDYRADVTPRTPLDNLKEIAKVSPEIAKALAEQAGFTMEQITVIDMTVEHD